MLVHGITQRHEIKTKTGWQLHDNKKFKFAIFKLPSRTKFSSSFGSENADRNRVNCGTAIKERSAFHAPANLISNPNQSHTTK
jgi:hypothetical protein